MTEAILYQSILQKLGQLSPNHLIQLDSFLSILIGQNTPPIVEKNTNTNEQSAIYWLEQLAENGGVTSIEDPVEWQRTIREDRKLPFR